MVRLLHGLASAFKSNTMLPKLIHQVTSLSICDCLSHIYPFIGDSQAQASIELSQPAGTYQPTATPRNKAAHLPC